MAESSRVNWLQPNVSSEKIGPIPAELRDQIYEMLIPSKIVVRDGQRQLHSTDAKLLVVSRRSEEEFMKRLQQLSIHIFESTSITELNAWLDSLPMGYFDQIREFSITAKWPYNRHAPVYGQNGFHGCNICPTFKVKGDHYHWEIELACRECIDNDFVRWELAAACGTILRKVTRVLRERKLAHANKKPGLDGIVVTTLPFTFGIYGRPYLWSELWGLRNHLPYTYR